MGLQQGFEGALGGGLAGFSTGNPWGAAIGAGLGLMGGLWGGSGEDPRVKEAQERLLAMSQMGYDPRMAQGSDIRGQQLSQLDRLTALAEGRGPSLASQMMQTGLDRAQGAQQSLAGSAIGRGVGPGAAYRNAASTTAGMQQQGIGQMGMARAAEQLGALGQLTGAQFGVRGQDEALSTFNAGQYNDANMRNRQLQMQALMGVGGMNGKPSPSTGEQLLAGGAQMFSSIYPQTLAGKRNQAGGQGGQGGGGPMFGSFNTGRFTGGGAPPAGGLNYYGLPPDWYL